MCPSHVAPVGKNWLSLPIFHGASVFFLLLWSPNCCSGIATFPTLPSPKGGGQGEILFFGWCLQYQDRVLEWNEDEMLTQRVLAKKCVSLLVWLSLHTMTEPRRDHSPHTTPLRKNSWQWIRSRWLQLLQLILIRSFSKTNSFHFLFDFLFYKL